MKDIVQQKDIDIDLAPSKLPLIFKKIREERGELGLVQIATFGTETTKSAILTSCRGYRSEEYPNGIDVDEAQYLSSLVPAERGFLWPIQDIIHGNKEKDRQPVTQFIAAANQYPGLLDIIQKIEGCINKRSSHASGVILFDEDKIFDTTAVMRTPKGATITQWDLHDEEAASAVKFDFLVTEVQDIIVQTIELLQKDGVIDPQLTLRQVYDKYLHPAVIPQDNEAMWKALEEGTVINLFQFDSQVGSQAAKKIKPRSMQEMTDANGLMRLVAPEKGGETPLDKYVRFKNNIKLWYKEMDISGLTKEEQKTLEPHFLSSYGVPPSQEQLMRMLMDQEICGFTLAEANDARKVVGKKIMSKVPALHDKVLERASSKKLGEYVWKFGVGPQMSYSFSCIHALAYSFVGLQTMYLATQFNPVYWNTACLIVNSGALEDNSEEEIVDIYAPESDDLKNGVTFVDLPDKSAKVRKTASTDYTKVAKAIGEIRNAGIAVSLIDINKSDLGFRPDAENNRILFGLKGVQGINNEFVEKIIANRPYTSMIDFYTRVKPTRGAMISLIKGGAFDQFGDRIRTMVEYIWESCDKKSRITLQNLRALLNYGLMPDTPQAQLAKRVFEFNRYLKNECKLDTMSYQLDDRAIDFLNEIDKAQLIVHNLLPAKAWDKVYQGYMDVFREYITLNKEQLLKDLNEQIFMEDWNKYAKGTISAWEMEVLCFYYHEHELKYIDLKKYGLADFATLPAEPLVEKIFKRGAAQIPIYKLDKICGTCIAKNKTKSIVYLLTTSGVVPVKFRQEYFSLFDRQISQKNPDGSKMVVEKSWFNRGEKLVIQGIRRGDEFVPKKYASSPGHQLYHIDEIVNKTDLILRHDRKSGIAEEAA